MAWLLFSSQYLFVVVDLVAMMFLVAICVAAVCVIVIVVALMFVVVIVVALGSFGSQGNQQTSDPANQSIS